MGNVKSTDEIYRDLAALSRAASGWCIHNPNVAAAVYDADGLFVAEGAHKKKISNDHAEVIALNAAGSKARGGTLYVSLEPCNHTGATGPCTEAIKSSGIKRVVYAVPDPNPIARGGARALQEAGIEAIHQPSSIMEFEQRAWLHRITTGRPLITAKVAITLDGYIAAEDGTSQWITSEASREDVQHLRAQVGAVITSTETFLNDQPSLLPRIANAPTPLRVVMGTRDIPSTQFTHLKSHEIAELIELLKNEGINHALVESGGKFLASLIKGDVVDELVIYQAPKLLGAGKKWVEALGVNSLSQALTWELLGTERIGDDVKSHYRRVRG